MNLNKISFIILLACLCVLVYVGYLLLEPFTPPRLTPEIIPILNEGKKIRQGEAISTKINYCVFKKVHSITTRRFEDLDDKRVFFLSTSLSDGSDPMCGEVVSNTSPVPTSIPPGRYKIILNTTYKVNPLKEVAIEYKTEEFEVIEGGE